MQIEIAVTFAVLGLILYGLVVLRAAPDLVLLGGMTLLLMAGIVSPENALKGFANEGLITVAVLFVVDEGLRQIGAIGVLGQKLLGRPKSVREAQARIIWPAAVLSAFMNNTPVVAMTLPLIDDWAKKFRLSVSHLLMPLSYAAILGGLCTLVGTSTTLVINGLLIAAPGGRSLGMFEIAWIGLPAAVIGLIYLSLFSKRLLPERKPVINEFDDPREYSVEMMIEPGSPLVGQTIEQAGLRHLPGMYLMDIDRGDRVLVAVSPTEILRAGDRLVFVGVVESVVDLQKIPGLTPATNQLFKLRYPRSDRCLVEAVVSSSCPFIRMTIREARFRSHYNAAVIAVARDGQRIRKKIGDIDLLPGDTLLLETHPGFIDRQRNSRDFFLVSRVENSSPLRHERAWLAQSILALMVIVVAFGLLSMLKAAMLAAGLMVVTRCCSGADARRAVDWSVLLVIGAALAVGEAMKSSHAAEFIADGMIDAIGNHPLPAMAVVYGITMIFTNLITAQSAAVLFFPVALATAERLGVNFMPFVMAVLIASSASLATPIGYQTNLMVHGPGGYRFSDYLRLGVPLSLIIWALTLAIAPVVWPF